MSEPCFDPNPVLSRLIYPHERDLTSVFYLLILFPIVGVLEVGMESPQVIKGFNEATSSEVSGEGNNYKLVPWISWDDWTFVAESLFSSSFHSIHSALPRVTILFLNYSINQVGVICI